MAYSTASMTFMHLFIGLAGATIAAYGGQKVGQDAVYQELSDKCQDPKQNPFRKADPAKKIKAETKQDRKKACENKYPVSNAVLHKIMMYFGCALIAAVFIVVGFLNSNLGLSRGMGMGGGLGIGVGMMPGQF